MGSGQNGRARRCADTVGDVAVIEQHAFVRDPIQIRGIVDAGTIARDRLAGVVVCHDEYDVGRLLRLHCSA